MNPETILQLTELCGSAPPDPYLALLQSYPDSLRHAMRAMDDSDSEGSVADVELLQSIDVVLALNCEARSDALVTPDGEEILWPEQFLIIGESGSGDYFCVDVLGEVEGVIQYDHQAVEWHVCAESLDEYVEMLVETFIEGEDQGD